MASSPPPATRRSWIARRSPRPATATSRLTANGSLESHTLRGINRHFKHLDRELGEAFPIRDLGLADLQGYVVKRTKAKSRRGLLNPATIRKEIVTLRTA